MTHKGSWQRPAQVSYEEKDLRYELAFGKDPKRKRAILKRLKEMEKTHEN